MRRYITAGIKTLNKFSFESVWTRAWKVYSVGKGIFFYWVSLKDIVLHEFQKKKYVLID